MGIVESAGIIRDAIGKEDPDPTNINLSGREGKLQSFSHQEHD
jgi:hypothetical protein